MTSSTITFIRLVTKILLSMVVLKLVTVAAIEGNFRLLYGESKDLLYYEKSHHQWHLCNINHTEVNLYEYNKNGYISVDCYRRNYKKTGNLKYAIFMTGSGDKRLGPPMCPPLRSGESYDWRCEKDMLSSAVTAYRNCTSVCKEGFYTVNHVTVRCSFTLDWIWFGDDTTPRCESGSPSTKVTPSNPNGSVYIPTTTLTTDFNWILKNLTSLPLNSTSTRLTWMVSPLHKENPFPRIYRLSYRVRGETTHQEIILNGGSVNHTLTNLQKETVYDIKLCALGNQDKKKICINTTTHINADKPVTQHSETNSKVYAVIIGLGGSIAGAGLICTVVFLAMYCCCKKNRSRDDYTAVPGGLSSSSSRRSQCSSGRCSCCFQIFNMDNSLETVETSKCTDTSNHEGKNEYDNALSYKYLRKSDESQPVDSGDEMCKIDSEKNEKQCNDLSFENNEIESSVKPVETDTAEENKQELLLSDGPTISTAKNPITIADGSLHSFHELPLSSKHDHSSVGKEGDSFTLPIVELKSVPNLSDDLSSLIDGSSGYASGTQTISVDLTRHDNCHENIDNVGGSSVGNNMVAIEHRPGPSSIQEYRDDQVNQLLYDAQAVDSIVKPDSFYFNRPRDEFLNLDCSIGQEACEQESNCEQQFPWLQRSSSPSANTLSDPGHVRSQSSTFADILQNQGTFPTEEGVGANITNTHIKKKECIQDVAENAQLRGHQFDSEKCSNQWTPCFSMNSVTHNEEDIYRRHPARLPTHECQEPCINHDCPTNNAQIYTYPASSEKEDKVQRSSRCQSLPSVIPQRNATNCNIQRSGMASTMCTLSVEKAKEELSPEFFQTLAYQLDPDSVYGNAKSWYGLTLVVLHWSEEKVKSIRHHTMGNIERGHFHATLEAYTAEHKFMSDIVKYFVQPSSLRPDIIQFIKLYHTDCPVCNALYLQVNRHMSMSQSTQDIIEISTYHHKNNS